VRKEPLAIASRVTGLTENFPADYRTRLNVNAGGNIGRMEKSIRFYLRKVEFGTGDTHRHPASCRRRSDWMIDKGFKSSLQRPGSPLNEVNGAPVLPFRTVPCPWRYAAPQHGRNT